MWLLFLSPIGLGIKVSVKGSSWNDQSPLKNSLKIVEKYTQLEAIMSGIRTFEISRGDKKRPIK